jgi:hypothetical protein
LCRPGSGDEEDPDGEDLFYHGRAALASGRRAAGGASPESRGRGDTSRGRFLVRRPHKRQKEEISRSILRRQRPLFVGALLGAALLCKPALDVAQTRTCDVAISPPGKQTAGYVISAPGTHCLTTDLEMDASSTGAAIEIEASSTSASI